MALGNGKILDARNLKEEMDNVIKNSPDDVEIGEYNDLILQKLREGLKSSDSNSITHLDVSVVGHKNF